MGRGFTHYADYILPEVSGLKTAVVVKRALASFRSIASAITARSEFGWLRPYAERITAPFVGDRKGAAVVNREFLKWLERRTQPERPFFAFLNYFDAHVPYQLPPGRMHRFGDAADDKSERTLIERWGDLDKVRLPAQDIAIALDAYDDCIADLDEQLGKLVDELRGGERSTVPGSSSPPTTEKASASTRASFAMAQVSTARSCTSRS